MPENNNFKFTDFRIKALHFKANENFVMPKNNVVEFTTNIDLSSKYDKKNKALLIEIGLTQLGEKVPFAFEINATGEFLFEKNVSKKELEILSNINCPAIMFPYVREAIADISRRGGFTPLHLNPINFVKLAQKMKDEKEKAVKT